MRAWYAERLDAFLTRDADDVVGRLASESALRHVGHQAMQIGAWASSIALLQSALAGLPASWWLALEYDLLRLEKRIDAVLLTDRAILVLEFKAGARTYDAAALRQVEDYALALYDFHEASRAHPVVPVLVATAAARPEFAPPLLWHGVTPVFRANAASLAGLLREVAAAVPDPALPLDPVAWLGARYRPVPGIIEAASTLFARNSVGDIAAARADTDNLTRTTAAILRAIAAARSDGARVAIFVTGIPGAGKTLCGMNVVFGESRHHGAAFLSGNAPLVAVLREALARNAAGADRKALAPSRRRSAAALQNVHRFLEDNAARPEHIPPERVIVFDEAQRAWDADKARRGTQNRKSRLSMSEPEHALEILSRHDGWAALVALIGGGQEINTGEAGLAEWGRAIAARGDWRALAAPGALAAADPSQRLADADVPWLATDPDLDLAVPIRSVRGAAGAAWVEALLAGDADAARGHAAGLPFRLTRSLAAMRAALRRAARGDRRAGLVASSGAKRLRAEGQGAELAGAEATVHWFLERWPDVRASDALEVHASEYGCQGLELDFVGMAWGGDFIRAGGGWQVRDFVGTFWQAVRKPAARAFVLNTYRVLLTRARYTTIIWVPPGDDADRTRPRTEMDAIADFLRACGVRELEAEHEEADDAAPMLL